MRKSLFFVLSILLILVSAVSGHQPPENLHLAGDHWTAWDPPASHPPDAEVYTVVAGDTLWDLAERYYGNPYLWPQIWERNRYVLDAHWIYPGDPLVLGVDATPLGQLADATAAAADAAGGPGTGGSGGGQGAGEGGVGSGDGADLGPGGDLSLDRSVRPRVPLGYESDIYCSGFIGQTDEAFDYRIAGSEYQALMPDLTGASRLGSEGAYGTIDTLKVDLSTGDIVYLDGGLAGGLIPGTLYSVIQPRERVFHPDGKGELLGRFYRFSGRLRVLSVQEETAIAEIVHACMPINVGDGLRPFSADPVPLVSRGMQIGVNDPVAEAALDDAPVIVRSESQVYSIGQDHVVYVDRGADQVQPGDLFTIYRRNKNGLPPVVIGELGILTVHENSAVAKVIESRHTVYIGDLLAPKH